MCWRRDRLPTPVFSGFPCGSAGKESACNVGDLGSNPELERSPGERKGYPLQYSGHAHLTSMQSTSCEMLGWMNYELESRWPREISITSEIQRYHSNGRKKRRKKKRKKRRTKETLDEGERGEWASLKFNIQTVRSWHLVPSLHGK